MANKALALKEEGNKRFQAGDYKGAESLYTQAITIDPSNSTFYTNRALVRVRQQSWDAVISDCLESIRLKPDNMKAYYYLAQAQIELNHPNEALTSALTAYEFCLRQGDASASNISALILRAKKEKWEHRERERVRRHNYLLKELEDALQTARKHDCEEINDAVDSGEMSYAAAREELEIVDEMTRQKIEDTRSFFAQCDPQTKLREVPEWLIDNITFSVMHDPVVTKHGHSYERSTILEHLRRSEFDPLTREPLHKDDLRTNIALKKACSDFLEKNGWAVDW